MKLHIPIMIAASIVCAASLYAQTDPPRTPPAPPAEGTEGAPRFRPSERWVEKMEKENPGEIERLKKLHREDPEKFREEMRVRFEKFREEMKKRAAAGGAGAGTEARPSPAGALEGVVPPELVAVERELREVVKEYRKAGEPERAAQEKKALELAGRIFDYRMAERRKRMESLAQELEKLRTAMDREIQGRDETIQRRLKMILSGASERSGERRERPDRPTPSPRPERQPESRKHVRDTSGPAAA